MRTAGHRMLLILFRHGPAGVADPARWPSDVDRPLTPKGVERTRAAAQGLARLVDDVAFIFTSPYARALGTARILADVLDIGTVEKLDALASGAAPRGMLAAIEKLHPERPVILVGHEPDLGLLAGAMIGSSRALPLKKAGSCAVLFEGPARVGGGQLMWHVPPRILRKLGGKEVPSV